MALKLSGLGHDLGEELRHQREEEDGDSTGTYFAVVAMITLLAMVAVYFWISNGTQFLASPSLQNESRLTPHDAF